MKKHFSQSSRKAPENRADRVSSIEVQSAEAKHSSSIELVKLGVHTHAAQYTLARMIDHVHAADAVVQPAGI
jgi:hypothetical protein